MSNKQNISLSIVQEQKETITRLFGIFFVVYGLICLFAKHLGFVLSFPVTYLFGLYSPFVLAILVFSGGYMLIAKKVLKIFKFYEYIFLIGTIIYSLACITILNSDNSYLSIAQAVTKYNNLFNIDMSFTFKGDDSYKYLGGGFIGYFITGLTNSFTKGKVVMAKLVVVSSAAILFLAFSIPYFYKLSSFIKRNKASRKYNKFKEESGISSNTDIQSNDVFVDDSTNLTTVYSFEDKITIDEDINPVNIKIDDNLDAIEPIIKSVEQTDTIEASVETDTVTQEVESEITKEKEVPIAHEVDDNVKDISDIFATKVDIVSKSNSDNESGEYKLPPRSLLLDKKITDDGIANNEIAETRKILIQSKFDELKIGATVDSYIVGPSVTQYAISLNLGVRVSQITQLQEDIKLALGVTTLRIESPIPNTSQIGFEVPNPNRTYVCMKELIESDLFDVKKLVVPVGKDVHNDPVYISLAEMPHTLVAGTTSSGKSVCMNSLITSLLLNYKPDDLKIMFIDPKRVEMAIYQDIPHLLCPVITDRDKVYLALQKLVDEMNRRYLLFSELNENVKEIKRYNEKMEEYNREKMPLILLVMDEFAEISQCKNKDKALESFKSIAQLGRAAGIHILVATQRPDVSVITGQVKNNLACRLVFKLASQADSKTVLDNGEAEKLLNNGDMLLVTSDREEHRRIQATFIDDREIEAVAKYVKTQGTPHYDENFAELETLDEMSADSAFAALNDKYDFDPEKILNSPEYEQIKKFIIETGITSSDRLKQRFGIGFYRLNNIFQLLEEQGIIGPSKPNKPREVLVDQNGNRKD